MFSSSIIGLGLFSSLVWNLHLLSCLLDIVCHLFQHNDFYSATKAEGEALVLKANGTNGLLTCSLRPSGIFGPGDRLLVPSLVANARAGKSKVSMFLIFVSFFCFFLKVRNHTLGQSVLHAIKWMKLGEKGILSSCNITRNDTRIN